MILRIRAAGRWQPEQLRTRWTETTRRAVPEVEAAIERAWADASARLGDKLFDGPMCRLESWSASPQRLELALSRTSYRPFLGTNLHNGHFADTFGRDVLANPVGLSTALETADGWLLLGRRSESVAYYPARVHPFAGAMEQLDIFAEVRRELDEELSLNGEGVGDLGCIGLAEDARLRQPELIFHASSPRTRAQVEANLDAEEHVATYPLRTEAAEVAAAAADPVLTPVAVATLLLWGRHRFGDTWFEDASRDKLAPG